MVGLQYGQLVHYMLPEYESLMDSYLVDLIDSEGDVTYEELIRRARQIKNQINKEYSDEISGFSLTLGGGRNNILGDGKISHDEYLVLNLMADVLGDASCSVIAVYGDRSATGKTIIGRNTDWFPGNSAQFGAVNAVIHIITPERHCILFSLLGLLGGIAGLNSSGVFIGNLLSAVDLPYECKGRRSIMLDLRNSMENYDSIGSIGAFFSDSRKLYTYHNNMLIADSETAVILENDFEISRVFRYESSELNPGITWGFDNAIACVNSFLLKGHHDNHTPEPENTERWNNYKVLLSALESPVGTTGVESIIKYSKPGSQGKDPGDIFNCLTIHSLVYSFSDNKIYMWMHDRKTEFEYDPHYTEYEIPFEIE